MYSLNPQPHFWNVREGIDINFVCFERFCRPLFSKQERFSAALDFFRQEQHGNTKHSVSFDALNARLVRMRLCFVVGYRTASTAVDTRNELRMVPRLFERSVGA